MGKLVNNICYMWNNSLYIAPSRVCNIQESKYLLSLGYSIIYKYKGSTKGTYILFNPTRMEDIDKNCFSFKCLLTHADPFQSKEELQKYVDIDKFLSE